MNASRVVRAKRFLTVLADVSSTNDKEWHDAVSIGLQAGLAVAHVGLAVAYAEAAAIIERRADDPALVRLTRQRTTLAP
jgi:hypothetical protein